MRDDKGLLKNYYHEFAKVVLEKDYLLSTYRPIEGSFDIVSIEEENDTLHIRVRDLLSKEYRFIERLVANEKVDISKAYERIGKPQIIMYGERSKEEELCEIIGVNERPYYEDILMLLSIQNSPIEFLISILK